VPVNSSLDGKLVYAINSNSSVLGRRHTVNNLTTLRRRVRGYWYVDGFQEVAAGIAFSVTGALFLAAELTSSEAFATAAFWALMVCGLAGFVATRVAKHHVTYARTGWVGGSRAVALAKIAAVVTWVAFAIPIMAAYERTGHVDVGLLLVLAGASIGVGAAWRAWQTGMRRFYVQGAVGAAAGIAAALAKVDFRAGFAGILLALGLTLLASGIYALAAYLRSNPSGSPEEAAA
jgi:hypothetical protein